MADWEFVKEAALRLELLAIGSAKAELIMG
jgi:hypothetical protein